MCSCYDRLSGLAVVRGSICTALLAKRDECLVRTMKRRVAAFGPPVPPLLLQHVDIEPAGDCPGIVKSLGIERPHLSGGHDLLHRGSVFEHHRVAIEGDGVVRQMAVLDERAHHHAKST